MRLSDCPSRIELELFAVGDLGTKEACGISDHIAVCPTCRNQLGELEQNAHGAVRALLTTCKQPMEFASSQSGFFDWIARRSVSLRLRSSLPQFIDGYRLDGCLGIGGTGVVFQAWHLQSCVPVAIKVLRTGQSAQAVKRFEREARIASSVDHLNVVKLLSTTMTQFGKPALVMEYFPSVDLRATIDQHGPLTVAQTATIGSAISRGVAHLHSLQILHRDVKPRNTLLTECGQVKLVDFGIAVTDSDDSLVSQETLITVEGQLLGTVGFTSPQVLYAGHSTQTDVFSICATLYYLLTGARIYSQCDRLEEYLTLASTQSVQPIAEFRNETSHPLYDLIEGVVNRQKNDYSAEELATFLDQFVQVDCLHALVDALDFDPPTTLQVHEVVKALSFPESTTSTQTALLMPKKMGWMTICVIVSILLGTIWYFGLQRNARVIGGSSFPQETLDEIIAITHQELSTDESLVATQLTLYNVSIRVLEAELQRSDSLKVKETLLDVYHNRGILEAQVGTQSQSIAYFRQELELAESLLVRYPDNVHYAAKQTIALGALAVMHLNSRDYSTAEHELQQCLHLERRVLALDRLAEQVARNHCVTYLNLSHLYLETERPERARQILQDAWSYLEGNWESNDPVIARERNLLRLNSHWAYAQQGNYVQAIAELEACVQGWELLLETSSDPNAIRMRLVEALREGADTYFAAGDTQSSANALRRANSIAAQVTPVTPNNKFHQAVASESSLNLAMLATQHPAQMPDVDVSSLVAESQKVFRELYEAEPSEAWVNQLKRTYICQAAAVREVDLEQAIEQLEFMGQLPDATFSPQLWRDFAREYSLCAIAANQISHAELTRRLDLLWKRNQRLFGPLEHATEIGLTSTLPPTP
ncbi:MAG: serine/threonine-protein kinase [Pirellulaceae bacterium]